jgi:hypothetical protein
MILISFLGPCRPSDTYLSILNEVKVKFDLGKTEIILENETQEDGKKVFWISLS